MIGLYYSGHYIMKQYKYGSLEGFGIQGVMVIGFPN